MPVLQIELHEVALGAAALWTICTVGFVWVVWRESRALREDPKNGDPPSDPDADTDETAIAP